jgi:hypothetical protein
MSGRMRRLTDEQLGAALETLVLEWPETPGLAERVMAGVRTPGPSPVVRLPRRRRTKVLLIAAAALFLLAGAAVAAKVVIDLGAVVVRVPDEPGPLPTTSPAPLGEPISLEEAAGLLGTDVPVPDALGDPDRIWADEVTTEEGSVVRVTVAWRARTGLPAIEGSPYGAVLMRFEGELEVASKEVHQDTGSLEGAWVGNAEALWTTGPHALDLLTADGPTSVRVDGNVLLWRDGDLTFRLETALGKRRAEEIAESVPGTS